MWLKFKSAPLLISSPHWGEDKGEEDIIVSTLTPALSRQRERESTAFIRRIVAIIHGKRTMADLRHIGSALLNFKSIKIGALLILK